LPGKKKGGSSALTEETAHFPTTHSEAKSLGDKSGPTRHWCSGQTINDALPCLRWMQDAISSGSRQHENPIKKQFNLILVYNSPRPSCANYHTYYFHPVTGPYPVQIELIR